MKKNKEIIQSKEFKVLIYYIIIAILLLAIIFFLNMPSAGNIPEADSDGNGEVGDVEGYAYLFGTLPAYAMENVAYVFISMICVMPIIIKIPFSIIIEIIQIFAIISKKNKRKLNYVASIMNLVISIIAFLVGFIGIFISVYSNALISLTMIIQGILTIDIIASILIISSNRKKIEQKLDLYNIEK